MTTTSFRRQGRLLDRVPVDDPQQVWLQQIGRGNWRVLDRRLEIDDVYALLGFVEQVGSESPIEVTLLDEPGHVTRCSNLDEARRLFCAHSEDQQDDGDWSSLARRHHAL